MTSLLSCLCKWGEVQKRAFMSPRGAMGSSGPDSGWLAWLALVGKPQTLWTCYLSASQGVGLLPYRKVLFICSSVHAQVYSVHPELVVFSCLWVSWVTCHPASIEPGIGEARTTALQIGSSTCGINCNVSEPTKFTQHPCGELHMYTYTYTYIHTQIFIYVWLHTCIYKHKYIYTFAYLFMSACM